MAVRKRTGKTGVRWLVDYYDGTGHRRYVTCLTRQQAQQEHAARVRDRGGNPHVTVDELAGKWLAIAEVKVRPQSVEVYRRQYERHIRPAFGVAEIARLRRSDVEAFLAGKLKAGLKPKTVSHLQTMVFALFRTAERDGIIRGNPAQGLASEFGLRRISRHHDQIKAMTPDELERFLQATLSGWPQLYPFFLTLARTGMRIGEAIALQWSDVDFEGVMRNGQREYSIHVRRTYARRGRFDSPKGGQGRHVDMSTGLREELLRHRQSERERCFALGGALAEWVFCRPGRTDYLRPSTLVAICKRILRRAELPEHFHPHCLRHTFASIHIMLGHSLTYIQQQLGHSSIQITSDIYGHWLSKSDPRAANELDTAAAGQKKNS